LPHLPLLNPQDRWWETWLGQAGVDPGERDLGGGLRLDSQVNEGQAAMSGQGFALLTPALWRKDVAEGRLVRPFDQVSSRGFGYWLVIPEGRRSVAKIKRFREWLLAAVARAEPPQPEGA
jgi:LysR family glycine cleavage system transcriptional activator